MLNSVIVPHKTADRFCCLCLLYAAVFCCGFARAQQPTIDKIDPPGWFANLPAPMLLLHGSHLGGVTITGAPVSRTVNSPNGHWTLVWLDTHVAQPTTLHLTATTPAGAATFNYQFQPRYITTDGIAGFSNTDVMICLMPDQFADGDPALDNLAGFPPADRSNPHAYHGGDLKGVIDHLDYLQQLGITAVWLTPVVQNNLAGRDYHGCGATELYRIDPRLGTLTDYQYLAAELHKRHMKLLFDDVPNHVGPAHPWASDPPLPDWFHGSLQQHTAATYEFGSVVVSTVGTRSRS